jgi:hypothetical protein
MEKEFVPYELALRMKQLGFDEPCFAYFKDEEFQYPNPYEPFKNSEMKSWCITAPLYQQAFRFFREKYRLKGEVDTADTVWSKWSFNIELKGSSYILYSGLTEKIYFKSYEEAELECLNKLIEIVKEKQL